MKKAKAEIIGLIMRTLLTVLLVALEACGVIAWPWYAVLAPLLIYGALWIVRAAVVAVVLMER